MVTPTTDLTSTPIQERIFVHVETDESTHAFCPAEHA